ncbi:MAG: response regulator [Anaerolineales bacterium]|nr:response regulator [Anaerolineales bacterium]
MEFNTVLIVDDEELGRETLEDLLVTQGFHLIYASNGPEALEKAAKFTPDIILLDVMMPGMNGYEVCQRLRANPALAEVPIIMVTALEDRKSRLQGIEAGADDFISKPFDRLELRARVKATLRLNRYRRLLNERSKFEWVVQKANEGYLMLGEADQILYANRQAQIWLDLAADGAEPYPETFLALAQKQYHCEPQELWLTWPEPSGLRYLVRPETPTANALWLQVEQMPMETGAAERYLLRLYDVTASMVKQSIMWSFHAQVSHKLRSPSTLLTGFLDFAEEGVDTLSETELRSYLSTAHKKAIELQDQLQAIFRYLEISRLGHFEQEHCSLSEVITLITKTKAVLELESVKLVYEAIEQPEQTYLLFSRQEVELIVWELLENARKFHPKQAPVVEISLTHHLMACKFRWPMMGRCFHRNS